MKKICLHFATLGPVGYFMAPGTMASILTLPLVYAIKQYAGSEFMYAVIVLALTLASVGVVAFAHQALHIHHDPSEIVLDEVVGCMFSFMWIPFTVQTAIMGLLIFRVLDISKRFGISHCEKLPGAIGIMVDDIVAGLLTALV